MLVAGPVDVAVEFLAEGADVHAEDDDFQAWNVLSRDERLFRR